VILAASKDSDVKLAVFRDDEQAVFSERKGRPEVDLVPFVLDENLRNTRQIVDAFRPLITANPLARGGHGPQVEIVSCRPDEVLDTADEMVQLLHDRRGYLPEHIALLTTLHRHNVQKELDRDKTAYWQEFISGSDVFYSTVSGFKGLERPVIVLAIDGFHPGVDPRSVRYAGMSRATELLIVVEPTASA
jgi:superfamily I DNA/RNA helicase